MRWILFALLILCMCKPVSAEPSGNKASEETECDATQSTTFCNRSKQAILLLFYDSLDNFDQVSIPPGGDKTVERLVHKRIRHANNYQPDYWIENADTVWMSLSKKGSALFSLSNSAVDTATVNSLVYINENDSLSFLSYHLLAEK